jgi:hypothetical protein
MPPIPSPGDLGDAGGWAAFGFLALTILWLLYSGKLVPKPFYDREVARADKATDQADRTAKVLTRLTNAVRRIGGHVPAEDEDADT